MISRLSRFYSKFLEDHLVLVDLALWKVQLLNPTASALWLLLEESPKNQLTLAANLADLFQVTLEKVHADVDFCLENWKGWIDLDDQGYILPASWESAAISEDVLTLPEDPILTSSLCFDEQLVFLGGIVSVQLRQVNNPCDQEILPRLIGVLSGIPRQKGQAAGEICLTVGRDYFLLRSNVEMFSTTSGIDVLSRFMLSLQKYGYAETDLLAFLHAAAVGGKNGLLLMPGVSGAGKSTLTAYLIAKGWYYAGDDIVALGEENREIIALPIPTAVGIKTGSVPFLKSEYPELQHLPVIRYAEKQVQYLPMPVAQHVGQGTQNICALVFPCYDPSQATTVERLSVVETVQSLMGSNFTMGAQLEPKQLDRFFDFIASLPRYRLHYPNLAEAERCLSSLVSVGIPP